jgi:hypothetical protein
MSEKKPFHLTGAGITIISMLTFGLALPFLLWARGPKTPAYRNKIIIGSLVGIIVMGVIGALSPEAELPEEARSTTSSTTFGEEKSSATTTLVNSSNTATPTESSVSVSEGSLEDLEVTSSRYLYKDCNQVDWCWQPRGTYTNTSSIRTITYLEVVYVIQAGAAQMKHVDRMMINLKPNKSTPILSGEYSSSFRLEFFNEQARVIGPLLGSSYVDFWPEVRYLRFSDGTSIGTRVG